MLVWKVYISNFNTKTIQVYNIFSHKRFVEDVLAAKEHFGKEKDLFLAEVKRNLQHYFWSKTEWELILTEWPPRKDGSFRDEKISVFDQVNINWENFSEYLWNNRDLL